MKVKAEYSPVRISKSVILYIFLISLAIITVFPFYHMIIVALRGGRTPLKFSLPVNLTLEAFTDLFINTEILHWIVNTIIYAGSLALITPFIDILIAYPLAKGKFPGRDFIFIIVLLWTLIPFQSTLVPLFILTAKLGLVNSLLGVIIPGIPTPMGVFFLRQYILSIPNDLIDSAKIDGCSQFQIVWRIIFPICMPALLTLCILKFVYHWGFFIWPLVVLRDVHTFTLPVGVETVSRQIFGAVWGRLFAGSTITVVPAILLYAIFQKKIISGLVLGQARGLKR